MKKLIATIMMAMVLLTIGVTAFAAEQTSTQTTKPKVIVTRVGNYWTYLVEAESEVGLKSFEIDIDDLSSEFARIEAVKVADDKYIIAVFPREEAWIVWNIPQGVAKDVNGNVSDSTKEIPIRVVWDELVDEGRTFENARAEFNATVIKYNELETTSNVKSDNNTTKTSYTKQEEKQKVQTSNDVVVDTNNFESSKGKDDIETTVNNIEYKVERLEKLLIESDFESDDNNELDIGTWALIMLGITFLLVVGQIGMFCWLKKMDKNSRETRD